MADREDGFQRVVGAVKNTVDAIAVTASTVQGLAGPLPDQPTMPDTPETAKELRLDAAEEALGDQVADYADHADRQLQEQADRDAEARAVTDPWRDAPTLVVDPADEALAALGGDDVAEVADTDLEAGVDDGDGDVDAPDTGNGVLRATAADEADRSSGAWGNSVR